MEAMIAQKRFHQGSWSHLINKPDAFFIGRGLDYSFFLEGALKLKKFQIFTRKPMRPAAGLRTIALITEEVLLSLSPHRKSLRQTISTSARSRCFCAA